MHFLQNIRQFINHYNSYRGLDNVFSIEAKHVSLMDIDRNEIIEVTIFENRIYHRTFSNFACFSFQLTRVSFGLISINLLIQLIFGHLNLMIGNIYTVIVLNIT